MVYWHRLLGVVLNDLLAGTRYKVEMERDLSLKQQMIDVLIIEQKEGAWPRELPEGLEDLARHNLLSFKSLRQPLDWWALAELFGHFVNYRKQASPSLKKLLPEKDFRLYAVCMRRPNKLGQRVALEPLGKGIYEVSFGGCRIRIIVLNEVAEIKRNALWQMFSGVAEKVRYGARNYNWRKKTLSKSINTLLNYYQVEGIAMPYTVEEFERELEEKYGPPLTPEQILKKMPAEKLLKKLPPKVRLKGLSPEARLKGLPPEARLKGLPPEARLKGLPPKVRLQGLTRKQIEAYLKTLPKSE
jgi:hypothetical protein